MEYRIKFETKVQAQQTIIELRKFVSADTVVDLEAKEVESMSGFVTKDYYVVLRKGQI